MEEVRQMMGSGPVYISFDIDSLDPSFAPGTGKPASYSCFLLLPVFYLLNVDARLLSDIPVLVKSAFNLLGMILYDFITQNDGTGRDL